MEKEKAVRLAPTKAVLRALFARSNNTCAFPGCKNRLIDEDNEFIGQICHIEAASEGGERFNQDQSDEERRSYDNLILLCYEHHVKTNNVDKYTTAVLKEMKRNHESADSSFEIEDQTLNRIFNDGLAKISSLLQMQAIQIAEHRTEFKAHSERSEDRLDLILKHVQSLDLATKQVQGSSTFNELAIIRQLREQNKQRTALMVIKTVREKSWSEISDDNKARVITNEALCHFDLNNTKEAGKLFIEAAALRTENSDSISTAAYGHYLLGEIDKAKAKIAEALSIDPNSINAYNTLIQINRKQKLEEICSQVPAKLLSTPEITFNLAIIAREQGNFEESISLFQKAVELSNETNKAFLGSLGSTIIESVTVDPFPIVTGQISSELKARLHYGIDLLSKAWTAIESTELQEQFSWLILNRGIAKKLLRQMAEAERDIRKALELKPGDTFFLKHLGILSFGLKRYEDALEIFNQIVKSGHSEDLIDAKILKADTLRKLEQFRESLEAFRDVKQEKLTVFQERQVNHSILSNYVELGLIKEGKEFLESLRSTEESLSWHIDAAVFYWNTGDKEEAAELLKSASNNISELSSHADLYELGNLAFNAKMFREAVMFFRIVADTDVYSPTTKRLIQALFNSGERSDALEICQILENKYGLDQFLAEGQCMIYESIDDVQSSIAVCVRYLSINPDDQIILLRLALNYNRLEQNDKVSDTLQKLRKPDFTLGYNHLFMLSALHFKQGNISTGLEIAYETRRLQFNSGKVHFKYFSLLTEFQLPREDHEFNVVEVGTAVTLQGESGQNVKYLIEDRPDNLAERGEIDSKSPMGKLLIGKRVNDKVKVKNPLGDSLYTIVNICSKDLHAFHESINLFQSRFIDESGVKVMNFQGDTPQERLSPILRALDETDSQDEQISDLYRRGQLPLGLIAILRGANPIRVFYQLANDADLGIRSVWHLNELANSLKPIEDQVPFILDVTSLMSLASSEALHFLILMPNEKRIAQATFDHFTEIIRDLRSSSEGSSTIGKVKGEYVRQEITPEQVKSSIEYYTKLIEWLKNNCIITSATSTLQMDPAEIEQISKTFGGSFYYSMLIAKELKGILLSDDAVIRNVSSTEHGVHGINTFLLCVYLLDKKFISIDEYVDFNLKLHSLNYIDLPIDVSILQGAAVKSHYSADALFRKVARGLASPLLSHNMAIITAVDFLKVVYTSFQYNVKRKEIAQTVLDSLFLRKIDLRFLANVLATKFKLLPVERDEIVDLIRERLSTDIS